MSRAHTSRYLLISAGRCWTVRSRDLCLPPSRSCGDVLKALVVAGMLCIMVPRCKILTTSMFEGDRRSREGMRRVPSVVAKGKQEG